MSDTQHVLTQIFSRYFFPTLIQYLWKWEGIISELGELKIEETRSSYGNKSQ